MSKAIIALVVAMFFVMGCNHNHPDETNPPPSNEDNHLEKESRTLFTKNLELFVEFDPMILGKSSSFLIHLTSLNSDYSPLGNASVFLGIKIDGKQIQEIECSPKIPGIYLGEISPQLTGDAEITIRIAKGEFVDQFIIDRVHVFEKENQVHNHNQEATGGEISFLKEQSWTTDFNVEVLGLSSFSSIINASGEILAMPGEKQTLTAKNNGIVLFSKRNLVQGSPVKKGEILFTVSGKGFTDDNISVKYQEAKLQFEKSKNQYLRHQSLVQEKIVSKSQFAESKNRYLADSVAYYNLKNIVSDGGLKVIAPLSGYIHELNVSEGQYASIGSVLATVSSNKVMLLRADVSQQFFKTLPQISDATFRPAYSDKVYTIDELNGKLLAKASSVAENNHYMPVYFEVINDGSLLEGAFVEFYLKTEAQADKLVVPVSALIEEQNNFYVYVQVSGETYRKQQVQLGDSDGVNTEVLSGLSAGERVVSKGAMLLKAASLSSAPVQAHSH